MDQGLAALIGAMVGAVAVLLAGLSSSILQDKQEKKKRYRVKKEEAYSNCIRYLLRAMNKRSNVQMDASGGVVPIMGQEVMKEWFDDLIEIQFWLTSLSVYCSANQRTEVLLVSQQFNDTMYDFMGFPEMKGTGKETADHSASKKTKGTQPEKVPARLTVNGEEKLVDLRWVYESVVRISRDDLVEDIEKNK